MTEEEKAELASYLAVNSPSPTSKDNIHSFLTKVIQHDDTTRLGYLKEEEIGMPKYPIRSDKRMALVCTKIMDNPFIADYFEKSAEINTSSSLSRD